MKTLYLECQMGAAGDMLMGALLELCENPSEMLGKLNAIGIPEVEIKAEKTSKCGIMGTHMSVSIHGIEEESMDLRSEAHVHEHHHHAHHKKHHSHTGMKEILALVEHLTVSDTVKEDVKKIYESIALAEGQVHGREVSEIHFHEVGAKDALADIAGCAFLLEELKPEQVIVSPITTGFGQIRCAHGLLPVPAPATVLLLRGIPCRAGQIEGELCTPTGVSLLKHFANSFQWMPEMKIERIGYGMGKKDFPAVNAIRAILGEA